jgi:hypothetical protein
MKIKKTLSALITLVFFFVTMQSVHAFSVTPFAELKNMTLEPGENFIKELALQSNKAEKYSLSIRDFYYNENNAKEFLPEGEFLPTGLAKWASIDITLAETTGKEDIPFTLKINVPEDVNPGAYTAAILVTENPPEEGMVQVTARIAILITANIGTENLIEDLNVGNFNLELIQGNYRFSASIENNGKAMSIPVGYIKIFDNQGNQINSISKITEEIDGVEVTTGLINELAFNPIKDAVLPKEKKQFFIPWENANVEPGTYVAKLEAFYGKDSAELFAEKEINVTKSLNISAFNTNDYSNNVPIYFDGEVQNGGTQSLQITPEIIIKNMFGQIVKTIPISQEAVVIKGGENYEFSKAEWVDGAISGFYTATLKIKHGTNLLEKDISLIIIVWWQIIVSLIILVGLLFGLVKFVSSYRKLAKKAQEAEKKVEDKE